MSKRTRASTSKVKWISANKFQFGTPSQNGSQNSHRKTQTGTSTPWIHENKAQMKSSRESRTRKTPMKASKKITKGRTTKRNSPKKIVTFNDKTDASEYEERSESAKKKLNKAFVPLEDLKKLLVAGSGKSPNAKRKKLDSVNDFGLVREAGDKSSEDASRIIISDEDMSFFDAEKALESSLNNFSFTDKIDLVLSTNESSSKKSFTLAAGSEVEKSSSLELRRGKRKQKTSVNASTALDGSEVNGNPEDSNEAPKTKKLKGNKVEVAAEEETVEQNVSLAEEAKPRQSWCTIA